MNIVPRPSAPPPSVFYRWDPHRPVFWISSPRFDAHSSPTPLRSPPTAPPPHRQRKRPPGLPAIHSASREQQRAFRRRSPACLFRDAETPLGATHVSRHHLLRLGEFHERFACLHVSGINICARWWIRRCLKCQACSTSRQMIRWPALFLSPPNSPGITVSVDYFGPLPLTPRGNLYILILTNRFSRRADMFAVTAAQFTTTGTADILFIDQCITFEGCSLTLISDNGLQF